MALITILTPTYNRAYTLQRLFNSLNRQTMQNFSWLIVDDGSTDETEKQVRQFKALATFDIEYIKKENGGKHTAINKGIDQIKTPLTIIVDSDDFLTNDAAETIQAIHEKYKKCASIGCYTFLRSYLNGKPIVLNKKNEFCDNYINYRIRQNHQGDMAEVFLTKVLKEHPFPVFENEKFISEDVVWIEIAKKYDSVYINRTIYLCQYLPDGLTQNDKRLKFASPLGSMFRGKQLLYKKCGIIANIKGSIIYNCYRIEIKEDIPDCLLLQSYEKALIRITLPLGIYYNRKWKNTIQ